MLVFFKQKTEYEMRISDWSSDVCSSDLTSRAESAPIKYEDTGVSETIAGIKGNIYRYVERGAKHEVVLGHDEDLKNAALGFVEIAKAMSAVMPTDSENMMRQNAPIKNMALLRLDGRDRKSVV